MTSRPGPRSWRCRRMSPMVRRRDHPAATRPAGSPPRGRPRTPGRDPPSGCGDVSRPAPNLVRPRWSTWTATRYGRRRSRQAPRRHRAGGHARRRGLRLDRYLTGDGSAGSAPSPRANPRSCGGRNGGWRRGRENRAPCRCGPQPRRWRACRACAQGPRGTCASSRRGRVSRLPRASRPPPRRPRGLGVGLGGRRLGSRLLDGHADLLRHRSTYTASHMRAGSIEPPPG